MVSIVIPVWNEDPRNLRTLHVRLEHMLNRLAEPWEVLFVDDGSDDVTRRTLQDLTSIDAHARLLSLDGRHGQETALIIGLLAAGGELICTMDCDLQYRPEEIPRVLELLRQGYDLVLGTRRSSRRDSCVRRWISRIYSTMMNARWGTRLSDWGCGFNAGRRVVFEPLRARFGQWMVGPLKLAFIRSAARWTEVEVTHEARRYGRSGYQGLHFWWHAIRMLGWGTSFVLPRSDRAPILEPANPASATQRVAQ